MRERLPFVPLQEEGSPDIHSLATNRQEVVLHSSCMLAKAFAARIATRILLGEFLWEVVVPVDFPLLLLGHTRTHAPAGVAGAGD
jgi:hypothetical protein